MRRNTLNFVVDAATLASLLGMVLTGLVIRFVLPPGSGGRNCVPRQSLWELSRHQWGDIHYWLAVSLGVLVLIHLALHWSWVCGTLDRFCGRRSKASPMRRMAYGIVFVISLVVLVGGFLIVAINSAT